MTPTFVKKGLHAVSPHSTSAGLPEDLALVVPQHLYERLLMVDVGSRWDRAKANMWWRTHLPSYVDASVPVDHDARTIPLVGSKPEPDARDDGDTVIDDYVAPAKTIDSDAKTPRV